MKNFTFYLANYRTSDNEELTILKIPFESRQCRLSDIQLRNVTRLDFIPSFDRTLGKFLHSFYNIK